jgi:hypothetical protein
MAACLGSMELFQGPLRGMEVIPGQGHGES